MSESSNGPVWFVNCDAFAGIVLNPGFTIPATDGRCDNLFITISRLGGFRAHISYAQKAQGEHYDDVEEIRGR
jgi:hypothetical protein